MIVMVEDGAKNINHVYGVKMMMMLMMLLFIVCWTLSPEAIVGFVEEYKEPGDNLKVKITLM